MQKRTKDRLILTTITMLCLSLGVSIILYNLNENITFFYTPSKLPENIHGRTIRVGGLVLEGSIETISPGKIRFIITDNQANLSIYFQGIPPTLFRENQGIVARGKMEGDLFIASELLAKHDENYHPPGITLTP